MSFLHQAQKTVNKLLSPFGVAVQRAEKRSWFPTKIATIRVGGYFIRLPQANPLAEIYRRVPGYMSHLGVAASLLKSKYPGLAVLDIGANVGDTACIIKSGADVPLWCVEGDDYTFGLLEGNLRQFQNVAAHKLFLGEKTGTLAATFEKSGWNATIKPDDSAAQKIQIVSLDDFLAAQPKAPEFKLMKIDAEGFDCAIIRGAQNFLRQARPALTFEYNRDNMEAIGENGLDTLSLLSGLGYSRVAFHDCDGRFFATATLSDTSFIRDLHDYADGKHGAIYYFDLTVFHRDDDETAWQFIEAERARRLNE
jgi:FkbM family methyltransferase